MIKLIVMVTVMFLVGYCNCNCTRKEHELLAVVGVFRHGDKTPKSEYFDVYPNNPWSNPKLWNHSDFGSVTYVGKSNMYNRGKWLRERYANFLPDKYSQNNIYIKASDSDRVLISAQLLLAGLFPPKGTDVWNDKLMWQPIPIHTVPDYNDTEVAQKVFCSKFSKIMAKQLQKEDKDFEQAKYLTNYTGHEITSLEQVYRLYKLLRIVEENGMVLPQWAHNAMPLLKNRTDVLCKSYSKTPELQRFTAGPLFYTLFDHFDAVLSKSRNTTKMLLFAGHSRTISNILMSMNAFTEQPPYTATLLFELKKNCNGTPIIDIFYQTTPWDPPNEIMRNIPYQQFKDQLKLITVDPTSWNNECRTGFVF